LVVQPLEESITINAQQRHAASNGAFMVAY